MRLRRAMMKRRGPAKKVLESSHLTIKIRLLNHPPKKHQSKWLTLRKICLLRILLQAAASLSKLLHTLKRKDKEETKRRNSKWRSWLRSSASSKRKRKSLEWSPSAAIKTSSLPLRKKKKESSRRKKSSSSPSKLSLMTRDRSGRSSIKREPLLRSRRRRRRTERSTEIDWWMSLNRLNAYLLFLNSQTNLIK